jgi:hypothetical protein
MKFRRGGDKELRGHYQAAFGPQCGAAGQAVFMDLYDRCGAVKTNFVPGDPQLSAFNDGCRSIFLYILQMAYEPEDVLSKLKETESTEYL